MRLDRDTGSSFKSMSEEADIPYQGLINLYLRDCAVNHRKLHMKWCPEKTEQQVWEGCSFRYASFVPLNLTVMLTIHEQEVFIYIGVIAYN